MKQVELVKKEDEKKWQDYVYSSEGANFFHLIEWKNILKKVYGYEPFYLIAKEVGLPKDNNEKIVGVFPIFLVRSPVWGKSLKSLPFHFLGGPIYNSPETLIQFLEKAKNLSKESGIKNFQIKSYDDYTSIKNYNINLTKTYVSFIIPLSENYQEVYKTFSKNIQRDIRYGMRDNEIIIVDDLKKLKIFYDLFVKSSREVGIPSHNFKLFEELWKNFYSKKMVRITMAKFGNQTSFKDKIIAAHFSLLFKDKILYMWGAIDKKYRVRLGMQALQGEAIKWGCENGYKYYDFGWTSPVEPGAMKYKSRWGTFQKNVYFYSLFHTPKKDRDYHASFKIQKTIWKKLPYGLVKKLGPFLAKHLG